MQLLRTPRLLRVLVTVCWLATCSAGCARLRSGGKSPLAPLAMAPECVQIEKYSVRYAYADPGLNDQMWSEIDEQFLPVEVRARLAANGFRVGVLGANFPPALMQVLRDNPAQASLESGEESGPAIDPLAAKPVNFLNEAKVRRGLLQTRAGHTSRILSLGEKARISQLAVLVHGDSGRVTGRAYEKVLGLFSLVSQPERDGRVRIELEPELEYGEPQQRYTAGDGMFRFEYRPETRVFNELKIIAELLPGQTLVIAGRADMPGSLGNHFFTERAAGQPTEQKLLLLRLMHSPGDDSYLSSEPRPARTNENTTAQTVSAS
ncbi:MAG TPA: hypothetical protein VGJ26_15050 [Pirellulales bacterium]|jgi:hypothetical protein